MSQPSAISRGLAFLRAFYLRITLISVAVLVPCVWQRHIEAGDLGSHVYNAWLAQLIGQGGAPGLYVAHLWHNVLFDLLLLQTANLLGFVAAEKIVVSLAVLIFFWGVFVFIAALAQNTPWFLTPCIAMLAYGYSFNMGFLNYYLSIGFACWSVAIFLGATRNDRLLAAAILPIIYLAHPIGSLFVVSAVLYLTLRKILPGDAKLVLPIAAIAAFAFLHWFLSAHTDYDIDWTKTGPFYVFNGSDQLVLYGDQYASLAQLGVLFGVICVVVDAIMRRKERSLSKWWQSSQSWQAFALSAELYVVTFAIVMLLPENIRTSREMAWIGLLVSRLTTVSAIFGLAVLACLKPRKWHAAGFVALAAAFFVFLHDDAVYLNQIEANAESVLSQLPYGTRVIPTLSSPEDSRIEFVGHLADRACIHRCFSYLNYEPSSTQFRVRATPGNKFAAAPYSQVEKMFSSQYVFQPEDLPLVQLYECTPTDRTKLCTRSLHPGDTPKPPQ
jgi:hypothetical protein